MIFKYIFRLNTLLDSTKRKKLKLVYIPIVRIKKFEFYKKVELDYVKFRINSTWIIIKKYVNIFQQINGFSSFNELRPVLIILVSSWPTLHRFEYFVLGLKSKFVERPTNYKYFYLSICKYCWLWIIRGFLLYFRPT